MAKSPALAALQNGMSELSLIGADEAARQGLRAVIREGLRCGFDTVQVAGVVFSRSGSSRKELHQGRRQPAGSNAVDEPKSRRRKKTPEQRARDAEKYRDKRMKRKLLAVLPVMNRVLAEIAAEAARQAISRAEEPAGETPSTDALSTVVHQPEHQQQPDEQQQQEQQLQLGQQQQRPDEPMPAQPITGVTRERSPASVSTPSSAKKSSKAKKRVALEAAASRPG